MLNDKPVAPTIPVADLARAKKFYGGTLGLILTEEPPGGAVFQCGDRTTLELYQRAPTKADHTVASFRVHDIEKEVSTLRQKGITFEEYDLPGIKTVHDIATWGKEKAAWFKDTEGNILGLSQHAS